MKTNWLAIVLASVAFMFVSASLHAEDSDAGEAEEAAAEEKAAAALPGEIESPLKGMFFKGTFTVQTGDDSATVLGLFKTTDNGYLVKSDDEEIKKQLKLLNGKTITVYGKTRNKNKYLIVSSVVGESEPANNRRKKKGF